MLKKPASIAANAFKSAKWDELTDGRNFSPSDSPTLELLCQWYAIVERCMDDLDYDGRVSVAFQNDMGDLKAMPQVGMLKQASAEIRAINKQLGINDDTHAAPSGGKAAMISVIIGDRDKKARHASA